MTLKQRWQTVWQWLSNFDVKPAKPIIQDLFNKVDSAFAAYDTQQAILYLNEILAINYRNHAALLDLSAAYLNTGRFADSEKILTRAIRYYPDDYQFYKLLGTVYARMGNLKASAKAYQHTLELKPDLVSVQHFLNSVLQNNTPLPPREYIVNLFNNYAENFEDSLIYELDYRAYKELVDFMCAVTSMPDSFEAVLDLGCGTGLFGQAISDRFKPASLIGIDLAENMLTQSKRRNIYTALYNADLIDYLQQNLQLYDLIGATDVFVYLGDLHTVFTQCYRCLKPGGYLAFSVESLAVGTSYKLMPTGRYKHPLLYLQGLSAACGFSKFYSQPIDLRKEYGNIVAGYLVLLQK